MGFNSEVGAVKMKVVDNGFGISEQRFYDATDRLVEVRKVISYPEVVITTLPQRKPARIREREK